MDPPLGCLFESASRSRTEGSEQRRIHSQALGHTTTRLQQISARAVETLEGVMEDEKASAASRVSAARLSLEMMYRGGAIDDIVERLKTVERNQLSHPS